MADLHNQNYGGQPPAGLQTQPEEGHTFRELLSLQPVRSEQENIRFTEWLSANAPSAEVALRNYRNLVSIEISVLEKFVGKKILIKTRTTDLGEEEQYEAPLTRDDIAVWNGELRSCTVGYVSVTVSSSHTRAGTEYRVAIESAPGQDSGLAYIESFCLAEEIPLVVKVVQDNLWHAQVCRFSILHNELRAALMRAGWLKEEFGHVDPKAREARAHEAEMMGQDPVG